ncbi:MAG: hypothetical protein JRE40_09505, partial [Deltaproteobacteria bacterium]|nr:hypothetical protein [Deltaproteobacteria bacterium]
MDNFIKNCYKFTGDAITDAAKVFICQFAMTKFNDFINSIGKDVPKYSSPYSGDYGGLSDYEASPYRSGISGAKERFKEIIQPDFSVRGDYDILIELVSCPDPVKAGPTNCVITDSFRQAISDRLTVGQAMKQGYLNPEGAFGFTSDGLEPDFNEGYPYRSMIILRKFRILPVGWELAAQYIKDNSQAAGGARNLEDMLSCFDPDTEKDEYDNGYNELWCQGLIDPDWVLKAPLNYCQREGPGPEILSERVVGEKSDSELIISRRDNYCADEQACINESSDGACQAYGYCTEERRKWNFNANSCEPNFNTCQTFRDSEGKTISYLENTLEYGICDADNAGCTDYCEEYNYINSDYNCTTGEGEKLYLDNDAEECDASAQGCHEFINTKPGRGANLIVNSSFEDTSNNTWWGAGTVNTTESYDGLNALQLGSALNSSVSVGPTGFLLSGEAFTLSLYYRDCSEGDYISLQTATSALESTSIWQFAQVSYIYPITASGNQVNFTVNSNTCLIDAVKLERGTEATGYSDYRGNGLSYLKLAPNYLNCNGNNDPAECDDYIRFCSYAEVGCNLYTSLTDSMTVPAKAAFDDYCPADCVGYDEYMQSATVFDSARLAYLIPDKSRTCSAEAVGCDEFTNLDKLNQGAEAREYYTSMRQCRLVDDQCDGFYVWEGSDETGYFLRALMLEQSGGQPTVTDPAADSALCSSAIYGLPATSASYEPDCREFYSRTGAVSYHLYSLTISCSDNCHPYRRTDINYDPDTGAVDCKNGGTWNAEHQGCIYMAIPGEGKLCSASQAGCREYSGSTGNNMRIIINSDFESGTSEDWSPGISSTESLLVGGHSLSVNNGTSYTIGLEAEIDKSYVIKFLAKSDGGSSFTGIGFGQAGIEIGFNLDTAGINSQWQLYEFNLARLNNSVQDYEVTPDQKIFIRANGSFFIDSIRLIEIIDRYYLIKDSSDIPAVCDYDIANTYRGPDFNLGCDIYRDQAGDTHYLHGFSSLCQESAIGCSLMIDTRNYSDNNGATFNAGNLSAETVGPDIYVYAVFNSQKQCNANEKGCQRLGNPYEYTNEAIYGDIYLKNDPDRYNEILCLAEAVDCEAWTSSDGSKYFKDPGDEVCVYRQARGEGQGGWGWFRKEVKRCNAVNNICRSDS